jgi:Fe2+ transport system protein FeoA
VKPIPLTQLKAGLSARISELRGSHKLFGRMEAMGIVSGTIITTSGAGIMKGPIVLRKDGTQIAVGYSTAQKILVEPLRK